MMSATIKALHKLEWCQLCPGDLYRVKRKGDMSGRSVTGIIRGVSQTEKNKYHMISLTGRV